MGYSAIVSVPVLQKRARSSIKLGISVDGGSLTLIDFVAPRAAERAPADDVSARVVAELLAYGRDPGWAFTLPMRLSGTPFQVSVWRALCAIPPGATRSYGALAEQLGSSARAIGNACRANPIPIIIPCHRVIARHGLGGYGGAVAGAQLDIKSRLLAHEGWH